MRDSLLTEEFKEFLASPEYVEILGDPEFLKFIEPFTDENLPREALALALYGAHVQVRNLEEQNKILNMLLEAAVTEQIPSAGRLN